MYLNAAPPAEPSCECIIAPCNCPAAPPPPPDRSQTLSDLATLLGVLGAVVYFFGSN